MTERDALRDQIAYAICKYDGTRCMCSEIGGSICLSKHQKAEAALAAVEASETHILLLRSHKLKCPACGAEGKLVPEYVVKVTDANE